MPRGKPFSREQVVNTLQQQADLYRQQLHYSLANFLLVLGRIMAQPNIPTYEQVCQEFSLPGLTPSTLAGAVRRVMESPAGGSAATNTLERAAQQYWARELLKKNFLPFHPRRQILQIALLAGWYGQSSSFQAEFCTDVIPRYTKLDPTAIRQTATDLTSGLRVEFLNTVLNNPNYQPWHDNFNLFWLTARLNRSYHPSYYEDPLLNIVLTHTREFGQSLLDQPRLGRTAADNQRLRRTAESLAGVATSQDLTAVFFNPEQPFPHSWWLAWFAPLLTTGLVSQVLFPPQTSPDGQRKTYQLTPLETAVLRVVAQDEDISQAEIFGVKGGPLKLIKNILIEGINNHH